MKNKYDLIIIGSGPAGSQVANHFAKKDWEVAVVDKRFGGTCAISGCTPKKAMETVSKVIYHANHLVGLGIKQKIQSDIQGLFRQQQRFTELVPADTKKSFKEIGIDIFEEKASFINENKLKVGAEEIEGKYIFIATGAKPIELDIDGKEHLVTTNDLFDLSTLPDEILFIGGGYVSFELAQIFNTAGIKVTILSDSEKPMSNFDGDMVSSLVKIFLGLGIDIRLGMQATAVEKNGEIFTVKATDTVNDGERSFQTKLVINTAGRVPATESLDLEKANIKTNDKSAIEVDEYFIAKGAKNIFAAGDVIGKFPFTPVASFEAKTVINNIENKEKKSMNYKGIPVILHTSPSIAMIGKSEKELEKDEIEFEIKKGDMRDWFSEKRLDAKNAFYKILTAKDGKILGVHFLSHHSAELINVFAVAIQNDLSLNQLSNTIYAYPTVCSGIKSMN